MTKLASEIVEIPTSFVTASDGTLYIGARGGVLRLTPTWPELPRYAAEFLWKKEGVGKRPCRPETAAGE